MALVCPELSLDLKPSYVPETINGFLREVSMISDASQKLDKLDHFVKTLEDEMNKIHVFKRELPLCMLLLRDAILFIKQEITQYKTRYVHQPVLEEFIPLKKDSIGVENSQLRKTGEEDCGRDKKNWMSSVQLWSADDITTKSCAPHSLVSEAQKGNQKVGDEACKSRGGSKGVVSLVHNNPDRSSYSEELRKKVEKEEDASVGGLTLVVPGMMKHSEEESIGIGIGISRGMAFNPKLGGPGPGTSTSTQVSNCNSSSGRPSHQQPSARKQRRCWSPELHRRFVDALTQLGGPQVATPKQIRELMRVDGLTNDEVKSHLQKYRLHSRRVPNDSGGCTNKNGHGLSGSWAGQDQYSESSKPNSSPSASPEGPHQFPGLTGGTSTTGGDSMEDEDDDDEKSESYSWKDQVHRPGKDDV